MLKIKANESIRTLRYIFDQGFLFRFMFLQAWKRIFPSFRFTGPTGSTIEIRKGSAYRSLSSIFYGAHSNEDEVLLFNKLLTPGDIFFDVGANVGSWSLILAPKKIKCIAIEPSSENFSILMRQCSLNKNLSIEPIKFAAGEVTAFSKISKGFTSSNSLKGTNSSIYEEKNIAIEFEECRLVSLDVLAQIYGVPTAIKIDVEGYNLEVVRGAREVLSSPILKILCIETNRNEDGCTPRIVELEEILLQHNFIPVQY